MACESPSSSGIIGHRSKSREGAEAANRVQKAVSRTDFWESASELTAHLYSRVREIYSMGTAAGASPNLRLVAWFYCAAGSTKRNYPMGLRGRASAGICVQRSCLR